MSFSWQRKINEQGHIKIQILKDFISYMVYMGRDQNITKLKLLSHKKVATWI